MKPRIPVSKRATKRETPKTVYTRKQKKAMKRLSDFVDWLDKEFPLEEKHDLPKV